MSAPRLSVLVGSIESRSHYLDALLAVLRPQLSPAVELLVSKDAGAVSIGQKRNALVAASHGEWLCFVDDDDLVAPDYAARILAALDSDPDCVGFRVARYRDGQYEADAVHSLRYRRFASLYRQGKLIGYERTPNHLNPIRRELVIATPFADLDVGEDVDYARRIYPLLRTEAYIDAALYTYLYRSRRPGEITHAAAERLKGRRRPGHS